MDKFLSEYLDTAIPPINKAVVGGLASVYMKEFERYIDEVFKSVAKSFPPGIRYEGYSRATVEEELRETQRPRNGRSTYDLADSDLYMVKYQLSFEGRMLPPKYVYMPFVGEGGILRLNGTLYHLVPVVSDKVISPTKTTVFVRLLRAKLTFKRQQHIVNVNGHAQVTQIAHADIHMRPQGKLATTTRAFMTPVHYLLAKYGYTEAFRKYIGYVPIVGYEEINSDIYPPDKWTIIESSQIPPHGHINRHYYKPTNIRLAIKNEYWNSNMKTFVGGLYYVIDHFSEYVTVDRFEVNQFWLIMLGHIVHSGVLKDGTIVPKMEKHFRSIDGYVDSCIAKQLKELGYTVENFYDLLALIALNITDWIVGSQDKGVNVFGKTLDILYNVGYPITSAIFNMNYILCETASRKPITEKEVIECLSRNFHPGSIFNLTKDNIAAATVSYSGDNLYPKITAIVEEQAANNARRGTKTRLCIDETKRIDPSRAEAGSILFLSKANPDPIVRINPFINIDLPTGTIIPNPKFNYLREDLATKLEGLTANKSEIEGDIDEDILKENARLSDDSENTDDDDVTDFSDDVSDAE